MSESERYSTRWMFRLLDYEHYLVRWGDDTIGQVVVNHADRSVHVIPYQEHPAAATLPARHAYGWWRQWLRDHESPLLP